MRLMITGGPRTGKTTEAAKHSTVFHTDDAKHLGWSEASAEVARWVDRPGPWCIEGVAVPRALRKWLEAHPENKPCDRVVYLSKEHEWLSQGQRTMQKGVRTVWDEVKAELLHRGVEVEEA